MGGFGHYLQRLLTVAFRGWAGQARAFPFYLSVITGAAHLAGYNLVLTVPTSVVAVCSFLSAICIGLVWAPYVLYSDERERADKAEAALSGKQGHQHIADGLAQFEQRGVVLLDLFRDALPPRNLKEDYLRWHLDLHDWAQRNLPKAEYVRIEAAGPFGHFLDMFVGPKPHPIELRLTVIRKLIDQYQDMAHGLR